MIVKDYFYIAELAIRDILHERILSICMACSLGAIFTPIIILLGLQQGIIGNMLDKLESDPASRLVRPKFMSQDSIPLEDLQTLRQAAVEMIPSETSHLLIEVEGIRDSINAVPSSQSDPFVLHSNPAWLGEEALWVVISESLSKKTGKRVGDELTLQLRRVVRSNNPEEVPMDFKIVGILEHTMMPDTKMYLPVSIFNEVYNWRKGFAASQLGLQGNRVSQFVPEYDGAITTFTDKKPKLGDLRKMLAGRLPFSTLPTPIDDMEGSSHSEVSLLWQTINSTVTLAEIDILKNQLLNHGYQAQITPYIKDITLTLSHSTMSKTWQVGTLASSQSPSWQEKSRPLLYISPDDHNLAGEQEVILATGLKQTSTTIPVVLEVSQRVQPGKIIPSHHFAGLIRSAVRAESEYNVASFAFNLTSKAQTRYFRVYADSIEQLDMLVQVVKDTGEKLGLSALKEPVSRLYDVQRIRTLSGYMKRIYFLIAVISGVSTIFAVSASVYATVQRRKKDLAYLNMLGVDRATIVFFPFVKSMMLILSGLIVAFLAYATFGALASRWFVDLLGETESLTRLQTSYALNLVVIIMLLGGLSSLLAGSVVSRMDSKRYIYE
ncbi:hypothetical protein [Vibrio sp. WXL103]|uniref:hypothetical protein n=1 Tax=Vibrio sp. WXL103 TaxID=3450710 RepID=UPI003EC6A583